MEEQLGLKDKDLEALKNAHQKQLNKLQEALKDMELALLQQKREHVKLEEDYGKAKNELSLVIIKSDQHRQEADALRLERDGLLQKLNSKHKEVGSLQDLHDSLQVETHRLHRQLDEL